MKSILKTVTIALGAFSLGVFGYALKEVQTEYDKNVDDYNKLLDKNRELSDFIENHDFYEKLPEKTAASKKLQTIKQSLKKVGEFVNNEGREVNVYQDKTSGFKVYEFGKIKKDA